MKKTLLMLLLGTCACAGAKTVALWPLNMDAERGSQSGRSLVSYHTLAATAKSTGIGTRPNGVGIPANVEVPEGLAAADFADDGRTWAIGEGLLDCPTLNPVLEMTNSWTIEGWFHLKMLPQNGNWIPLFHTRSNAMGWLFTIRQRSAGIFDYELFAETCVADGTRFLDPVDPVTVTNGFHHYALTYDHDAIGVPGKGVWTFYIDGEKQGVSITNTVAVSQRINTTSFEIMGRNEHKTNFAADYIRVSDEALEPSQFLCAEPMTPVQPGGASGTLGYWRLDRDGALENLANINDVYPLGIGDPHSISPFKAFETCPNASANLPANNGSLLYNHSGVCMTLPGLGSYVDFDKAFTLEGWFFMEEWARSADNNNNRLIFSTRGSGYGFHLWYNFSNKAQNFSLYARASNEAGAIRTQLLDTDFPKSTSAKLWNSWHHIALTYDPEKFENKNQEKRGGWELFVDGTSLGCLTNALDSSVTCGQADLYVAGRPGNTGAAGYVDTVRLTKRVLVPSEFLCAEGGTSPAAEDVEGLWPLGQAGLVADGTDLTGKHPLWTNSSLDIRVDDASAVASVPNPPAGIAGAARDDGSLLFPTNSAQQNCLTIANIHKELDLSKDFTVEAWFRFDQLPTGWHSLFINGGQTVRWVLWIRNMPNVGVRYMTLVQHTNGYSVPDNTRYSQDVPVPSDKAWHHHALVYRAGKGTNGAGEFELYLDGTSLGTISRTAGYGTALNFGDSPSMLAVGGRPVALGGNASFKGAVDLLRVSGRALATNEFLNATVERPAATTKTVAYWPFDANGAVADLTSRVDERLGIFHGQTVGEADQFGRRVHNPDATPDFIGDPSANAGSIRVTGVSGVTAHAAANWVLPEHSFTLEGWVKLAASPTKPFPQTLVTNDRDEGGYRASFTLDLVDAETLRLVARSRAGALTVSQTFPVPAKLALPGAWRHVALAHDVENLRWHLYLDGELVGTAQERTAYAPYQSVFPGSLVLGGNIKHDVFDGLLDTWRLSVGVLAPENFLYVDVPKGTFVIIR